MVRQVMLLGLVPLLLVGGCQSASMGLATADTASRARRPHGGASLGADVAPLDPGETGTPFLASVEPRQVIYTATLRVVVSDAGKAVTQTRRLAEGLGGYMQRMTRDAIVVRVPAAKFDETLAGIEKMGPVNQRDVTARDVTDEYVDLRIRLANAKALLGKLQDLLDKAQNVKEALAVEQELARVRTEIEKLEGRMNSLTSRIAFSTISVAFRQMTDAPGALKVRLPFWWLSQLGLDALTRFH